MCVGVGRIQVAGLTAAVVYAYLIHTNGRAGLKYETGGPRLQVAALDSAGNYLKDTWCVALRNAIRNSFKDVGKGWFNLGEASMETYEFSKLRKFLTLTRFVMEDTMRALVEDSLGKFTGFIQSCCPGRVTVHSTSSVEILDASSPVPVPAIGPGRKPPLLVMDLATNKEATRFVYSTQPESIVTKIMALFDAAIGERTRLCSGGASCRYYLCKHAVFHAALAVLQLAFACAQHVLVQARFLDAPNRPIPLLFLLSTGRTQGLHTLEPAIMENLFWATAPVLSTVHQQEEIVVRHRELLRAALSAALVPLEEYMAKFEK